MTHAENKIRCEVNKLKREITKLQKAEAIFTSDILVIQGYCEHSAFVKTAPKEDIFVGCGVCDKLL